MSSSKVIGVQDLPKDLNQIITNYKDTLTSTSGVNTISPQVSLVQSTPTNAVNVPVNASWEQGISMQAKKMVEDGRVDVFKELQEKFERAVIQAALDMTRGRKVEAAERLGIGRNTITRKLQELGIEI